MVFDVTPSKCRAPSWMLWVCRGRCSPHPGTVGGGECGLMAAMGTESCLWVAEDSCIFSFSAAEAPGENDCSLVSNLSLPPAFRALIIPYLARGRHLLEAPC